jgi:hypothetical protein
MLEVIVTVDSFLKRSGIDIETGKGDIEKGTAIMEGLLKANRSTLLEYLNRKKPAAEKGPPSSSASVLRQRNVPGASAGRGGGGGAAAAAFAADFAPLADRLRAALRAPDQASLVQALGRLRAELPTLARAIIANPAGSVVLERAMTSALFNGMEAAPKATAKRTA